MRPLAGQAVVVTGATAGIGLALAETLAAQGACVVGVGRDPARCAAALARVRAASPCGEGVMLQADLAALREVRRVAAAIQEVLAERGSPLHALVNNAGVFSSWYFTTPDGFELQFAVNQLAPFALTHLLMGALTAAPAARVVTVSSGSHHGARLDWRDLQRSRRYTGLGAYRATKLMNVLFTLELSRRLADTSPVRAYAADPGLVATDLGFKGTGPLARAVWAYRKRQGRSPQEAAAGIAHLLAAAPKAETPYWRDGRPAKASRAALDPEAARRLWGELERMSGLDSAACGLPR